MARRNKRNARNGGGTWSPRILKDQVLTATVALVVCLFAGAGLLDRYIEEHGSPYIAAVIVATLVDLANTDRAEAAVGQLSTNPKLVAAAQAKADDMATKGYFSHETPEGYDSWHWFKQVGYGYTYAGENLAVNFSESSDVQEAWMSSPTHRDNILNGNYTEIGIAVAHGEYKGRPATFAVQMFGKPSVAEVRSREVAVAAEVPAVSPPPVSATSESVGATLGEATESEVPVVSAEDAPWWARLAAEPKQTLRIAYYVIGLLILAGLFFDFELELKWHHFRHAKKVGMVLATMSMLFIAADWLFFGEPVLAVLGALT